MHQEIFFGIESLTKIIKQSCAKKLFIVTGSNSYHSSNFKEILESLDIDCVYFTDFTPNPIFEQICKGVDLFKTKDCDAILAIGGGSPIDVAKCIKLSMLAYEGFNAIIPPLANTLLDINGRKIPFIAIPTTAGTGSESTHNAVMYYKGNKQTVTNDSILPDYALLEPSVLKTLPLYQKKCTIMDALCQGIESWWSINSTDESKEYSKKAVELINNNWERYIFNNDEEAAANIMLGANYSGRAINIAQTTAAHAMSYKITSMYGLPHGHAVACCLPPIWRYMINNMNKCIDPRGKVYLSSIFDEISRFMNCDSPMNAIDKLHVMLAKMEMIPHFYIGKHCSIALLSNSVNSVRLNNNPIFLSKEIISKIYAIILKNVAYNI